MSESFFPRGSGHDILQEGMGFFLSLLGTNNVATAENEDVNFRAHSGRDAQKWLCVRDKSNHLGFKNKATGGFLSCKEQDNISNYVVDERELQRFHPSRKPRGGSQLTQVLNNEINFVTSSVNEFRLAGT